MHVTGVPGHGAIEVVVESFRGGHGSDVVHHRERLITTDAVLGGEVIDSRLGMRARGWVQLEGTVHDLDVVVVLGINAGFLEGSLQSVFADEAPRAHQVSPHVDSHGAQSIRVGGNPLMRVNVGE
ncbi:MAG: hypothetical protein RLZZ163_778 [Actinomycetota bacterium]